MKLNHRIYHTSTKFQMLLTFRMICLTAGESGAQRICPISMGLTEFHTTLVAGLDSSSFIKSLQKEAAGKGYVLDTCCFIMNFKMANGSIVSFLVQKYTMFHIWQGEDQTQFTVEKQQLYRINTIYFFVLFFGIIVVEHGFCNILKKTLQKLLHDTFQEETRVYEP